MKRSTTLSMLYVGELPIDLALWLHLNQSTLLMPIKITLGFTSLFITIFTIFLIMSALMEGR